MAALLRDAMRDRRGDLAPLLTFIALGAVAETIGLLLLVPLVALASGEMAWPAIGFADPLRDFEAGERLAIVTILFVVVMIVRAAILALRDRKQAGIVIAYSASLRERYLTQLAARGWSRANALGESGMQRVLLGDAARVTFALEQALGVLSALFLLVIQGAAAMWLSPSMTILALAMFVIGLAISLPLLQRSGAHGLEIGGALRDTSEEGGRLHQGLKTALAEGEVARFLGAYRRSNRALAGAEHDFVARQVRSRAIASMIVAIGAALLLLAGRLLFDVPIALLLPLLILFARLSGPARQIYFALEQVAAYAPAFASFDAMADPHSPTTAATAPIAWQALELDGVTQALDDGRILGPFDLKLTRGQWLGLAGVSGSGKSSLVDMIAGLTPPSAGEIRLDGAPVTLAGHAGWAAGLSYVGQGAQPVDGTLADLFGPEARDPAILSATGVDAIAARIGWDRPLGYRGSLLSGGENQRVAIARALHRRPALLILDEATAALDLAGEAALLAEIRRSWPDMAVLLVAHRPETLSLVRAVYRLDGVPDN